MSNLWSKVLEVAKSGGKSSQSSSSPTTSVKSVGPSMSSGPSSVSNSGVSSLLDTMNYSNVVKRVRGE